MPLGNNISTSLSLVKKHLPGNVCVCEAGTETAVCIFRADVVELEVNLQNGSILSRITDLSDQLNRRKLDPLRQKIRLHFIEAESRSDLCHDFNLAVAILQSLEVIVEFESQHCEEIQPKRVHTGLQKWNAAEVDDWSVLTDNPFGLDASSVQEVAFNYLKKTPQQIADVIPPQFRVVHIEPILRRDLAKHFRACQTRFRRAIERCTTDELRYRLAPHSELEGRVKALLTRVDIIDDMLRPRLTFHGTNSNAVHSIVRHGFKLPGKLVEGKVVASPRSGIAFDRGIYSSPSSLYAVSYASGQYQRTPIGNLPAMRLVVCATLMGRTCNGRLSNRNVHGQLVTGHESHFDGGFEYITYDEQAILPCYVVHLDLGSEAAREAIEQAQENPNNIQELSKPHPRLVQQNLAPGDAKREKERKKAAAMKWFPNGFGPAKGTSFVIEEIGQVDDDEEDYGEWQAERHAFVHKEDDLDVGSGTWYEDWDDEGNIIVKKKGLLMDQYQAARHSNAF